MDCGMSRRAGIALGLLVDPVYAEDTATLELEATRITSEAFESATSPVKGYRDHPTPPRPFSSF